MFNGGIDNIEAELNGLIVAFNTKLKLINYDNIKELSEFIKIFKNWLNELSLLNKDLGILKSNSFIEEISQVANIPTLGPVINFNDQARDSLFELTEAFIQNRVQMDSLQMYNLFSLQYCYFNHLVDKLFKKYSEHQELDKVVRKIIHTVYLKVNEFVRSNSERQ